MKGSLVLAGCAIVLVGTGPAVAVASPGPAAPTVRSEQDAKVRLSLPASTVAGNATVQESPTRTTGKARFGPTDVTFAAEKRSRVVSTTDVTVAGKRLTMSKDVYAGIAKWSGAGVKLTPADRQALHALGLELERRWNATGNALAQNELLIRALALYADAPSGVLLVPQVVPRPDVIRQAKEEVLLRAGPRAPHSDACVSDLLRAEGASHTDANAVASVIQACQVADDDGIVYMSCRAINRTLWHDAAGHCFLSQSVLSGPGTFECLGRCGPACALGGGIYAYDCGEHDKCCRDHGGCTNPWDSECGDEFFDADDDFLWGSLNC